MIYFRKMKKYLSGQIGTTAEHYAEQYLKQKGYEILGNNYRKPWGEIDIIAQKEGILIFVEVKANTKEIFGFEPELRVNKGKQFRMQRIAETYLKLVGYGPSQPWQLDIISLVLDQARGVAKIKHFKNI